MDKAPATLGAATHDPALKLNLARIKRALEEGKASRSRVSALESIVQTIQAGNPLRETLQETLLHLRDALGARFGFVLVLSDRESKWTIEIFEGFDSLPDLRHLIVDRLARPVSAGRAPAVVPETMQETRIPELRAFAGEARSAIAVPLASRTRVFGVLGVLSGGAGPRYGDDDASFLLTAGTLLHGVLREASSRRANLDLLAAMVRPLTAALEARDTYTHGHSERVAKYALAVVHELEMAGVVEYSEELRTTVRLAAFLHDIGKIGVSDTILHKPGDLTREEFEIMKAHTMKGAQILEGLPELTDVVPGIVSHHERWDGKGYPHGLRGNEIPFLAKVIGIADALDAMTTDRPYMKAMPLENAVKILRDLGGTSFDPEIVAAIANAHRSGLLAEGGMAEQPIAEEATDYLTIEKIFSKEIRDLPALPQIVTQILERTRDPNCPAREIVRLVSRDQALVIKILRLVNSAYYGFSRKIATINLAVAILGYRAVQNLVLNVGLASMFRDIMNSTDMRRVALFEHSMECAVLAKALAARLPSLELQQDEAFTAGLLHDIGKIVLEQHAPSAAMHVAAAREEKGISGIEAEVEVLGVDHAAVGEWIAMRWNIPARLREAILYHHRPHTALEKAPGAYNLVKVIALADQIDHLMRESADPAEILAGLATSPVSDCGLTPEAIGQILETLEQEKAEFHRILTLGDGSLPDHA